MFTMKCFIFALLLQASCLSAKPGKLPIKRNTTWTLPYSRFKITNEPITTTESTITTTENIPTTIPSTTLSYAVTTINITEEFTVETTLEDTSTEFGVTNWTDGLDTSDMKSTDVVVDVTKFPEIEKENQTLGSSTSDETTLYTTSAFVVTTSTDVNSMFPGPRHIMTPLEEKLSTLNCGISCVPEDARLWKGNETHELLLPLTIPSDCPIDGSNDGLECSPLPRISWEGVMEIQSGDVLLVRIDDLELIKKQANQTKNYKQNKTKSSERMFHEPQPAVYQVTRTGYDHCDITEGVLLDITPLKVEQRKVVTLYDKDLTEGINLLIVVSELWGSECVRLKVTVKSDNCGENEDCSGKGICYSNMSMEGYECQCCSGYVGPHCEEQDACFPSPCINNGICVDISQGHEGNTFQCLCPYGFTGKTCEDKTDPCTSMPCQNGATCVGNISNFYCQCSPGFSGPQCEHSFNACESSPCIHGICVDQEDGFRCYCQPGYGGEFCSLEYDECLSDPCENGGTCTDLEDNYSCECTRGYTGKRCDIKVNLCEPNPCSQHHFCIDHGRNYTCECPTGYSGPDCLLPSRTACSKNPCLNGGTCWSSVDSFYCACRPGYTGKTCEDEFVVETIANQADVNGHQAPSDVDMQMPISIHLDHLHNIYIAAGTLACAFVIVGLIVAVCHCRVNKTYQRFIVRAYPLLPCKTRRQPEPVSSTNRSKCMDTGHCNCAENQELESVQLVPETTTNGEWFTGKDKAPSATPSRSLPSLDTTDMYYTLDFSESQSSPLIQ